MLASLTKDIGKFHASTYNPWSDTSHPWTPPLVTFLKPNIPQVPWFIHPVTPSYPWHPSGISSSYTCNRNHNPDWLWDSKHFCNWTKRWHWWAPMWISIALFKSSLKLITIFLVPLDPNILINTEINNNRNIQIKSDNCNNTPTAPPKPKTPATPKPQ